MMDGKIENLFLKVDHDEPMSPIKEAVADSGKGIKGDKSYGRNKRQVLLIEKETLDEFGLEPGWVCENITVSNIKLAGLEPGTILLAGDVSLEVTGDCAPCQLIDDIKPGLRSKIDQRRGTLCVVKDGGAMRVGDPVRLAAG